MIKMKRLLFRLILLTVVLGACVPAKKLVYLQEDDELKKRDEISTDSIYREHDMQIGEYRIQPLDNLNIRFETITDDEFNFFRSICI